MLGVAEIDVHGREEDGQRRGEDDDGGQRREEEPELAPVGACRKAIMNPSMTIDWKKKNMKAEPTEASDQDLAGERHLLHDAGVGHHRVVPLSTRRLEEVPDEHGREHVDDEVGDAVGQEVGEQDVEDGQGQRRVEHRPQEAEDRVLVLDLDLLADQEDEQLPGPPQLAQPQPDAHPGGDRPGWACCPVAATRTARAAISSVVLLAHDGSTSARSVGARPRRRPDRCPRARTGRLSLGCSVPTPVRSQ